MLSNIYLDPFMRATGANQQLVPLWPCKHRRTTWETLPHAMAAFTGWLDDLCIRDLKYKSFFLIIEIWGIETFVRYCETCETLWDIVRHCETWMRHEWDIETLADPMMDKYFYRARSYYNSSIEPPMPNKHKFLRCEKCNKEMRSNNLLRHQKSHVCGKYNAGSS
jgi:hypothetical protein